MARDYLSAAGRTGPDGHEKCGQDAAPSFLEQTRYDDALRARLRDAFFHSFGRQPTEEEIENLVRKEFARVSDRLRSLPLRKGGRPAYAPIVPVSVAGASERDPAPMVPQAEPAKAGQSWLSNHQLREAEAAFAYANSQGIDSVFDAVRWYRDHRETLINAPLVPQCVDEFLCAKRGKGCAPMTLLGYRSKLERFAQAYANRRPAEISPRELGRWMVERSPHPRTRLDWWMTLSTFFSWCRAMRYAVENPVPNALSRPKPARGSQLVLTPVEARRILRMVRDTDQMGFWILALFAGLRTEEIRRLQHANARWNLIRLRAEVIDLPEEIAKTYARRIPILPVLRPWLELARERRVPFLPSSHYLKCRRLRNRVLELRTAALDRHHHQNTPEYRPPIWGFNIARRSFITYRVASGQVSYAELANEVGNSESILRRHYFRHATRKDAEEYFSLTPDRL